MKMLLINGPVVDDSDVWFYDYWGDPCVSPKKVRDFLKETNGEDIKVSINSGGGSVFAGSEIYTMLKSYPGKVDVMVSGLAASIASVIMLAGDTIKASPLAQIMIHNATMTQRGDYRDFAHASVVIGGVSQSLVSLYVQKTGLTEEEIKAFVDDETWFTAERAKELGFVDEVLFHEQPAFIASAGLYASKDKISAFKKVLDEEQAKPSMEMANLVNRIEMLENDFKILRERPIAESTVEITLDTEKLNQAIRSVIADLEHEKANKAKSPFAKFI